MKIIAFGEVMMRLTPPHYKFIEQTDSVDLSFSGTGLNILSNLSRFGYDTSLVTSLPDNQVGRAASSYIRKLGVSDTGVAYKGNHIGIYFLEMGFGARPSEVTYLNRSESSFSQSHIDDFDLNEAIKEADMMHICGISLMVSETVRETTLYIAKKAKELNKMVCFDFNYRPSINIDKSHEWVKEQYEEILPYCDIVFGGIRDLTELLDFPLDENINTVADRLNVVSLPFVEKYGISLFAGTLRENKGDKQFLKGFLRNNRGFSVSTEYELDILDRIGTGDAFAAGIITGVIEEWSEKQSIEFAVSNAVLAHTTYGDTPLVNKKIVEEYMNGNRTNLLR